MQILRPMTDKWPASFDEEEKLRPNRECLVSPFISRRSLVILNEFKDLDAINIFNIDTLGNESQCQWVWECYQLKKKRMA